MNEKEFLFLCESINSKSIPTPKLLIKDHKNPEKSGNFPSRLVVPATNFAAGFPRIGYLGIKRIFNENDIVYNNNTIIQASDLKEDLEKLALKRDETTIISLHIKAMYPSIKFDVVKKAVKFFAKNLEREELRKIETCLEMIKFGMSNTLLTF